MWEKSRRATLKPHILGAHVLSSGSTTPQDQGLLGPEVPVHRRRRDPGHHSDLFDGDVGSARRLHHAHRDPLHIAHYRLPLSFPQARRGIDRRPHQSRQWAVRRRDPSRPSLRVQGISSTRTEPVLPSTSTKAPSGIADVAPATDTTHGIPSSRLTMTA